ncbi:MAG: hypothetical protein AABN34_06290 [Acidobacteriota bacterium]
MQQVFGILVQRDHSIDVREQRLTQRLDEFAERGFVSQNCALD